MKFGMTLAVLVLFLSGNLAFGADIDGKWAGEYDSGMGGEPMTMEFTFKADGTKLTGTTIGGEDGSHIPISDGKSTAAKFHLSSILT